MKKLFVLIIGCSSCSGFHYTQQYVVTSAEPKYLVTLQGKRGQYVITPADDTTTIRGGDTICLVAIKKIQK